MDLEDFDAFTRAHNSTISPFKRIIGGLIIALIILILFQGYIFLQFMNGAFEASNTITNADVVEPTVLNSVGS